MEITIQQKVGYTGIGVSRRNFKLKNGSYENSAYNDGGVHAYNEIMGSPLDKEPSQ